MEHLRSLMGEERIHGMILGFPNLNNSLMVKQLLIVTSNFGCLILGVMYRLRNLSEIFTMRFFFSFFFIIGLQNAMKENLPFHKSNKNTGRDSQNQLFQNSQDQPLASSNLKSVYFKKSCCISLRTAGFVAL